MKKFTSAEEITTTMTDLCGQGLYNIFMIGGKKNNRAEPERIAGNIVSFLLKDGKIATQFTQAVEETADTLQNDATIALKPEQSMQVIGTYTNILLSSFAETTQTCFDKNILDDTAVTEAIKANVAAAHASFLASGPEMGLDQMQMAVILPALRASELHATLDLMI